MTTANRLFTAEMLAVILQPASWRLVTSRLPEQAQAVASASHAAWMRDNSHEHPLPEILFVLRGSGEYGYRGDVYPAEAGTVFVFDAFEEHDLGWPPWAPEADHLWIRFTADTIVANLIALRGGEQNWGAQWVELLRPAELGLASATAFLAPGSGDGSPELARLRLTSGLGVILGALVASGLAEPRHRGAEHFRREIVQTVQRHLQETGGRDADLDSLSRLSGYSKFHFLRLFRRYTGVTVHEYVDQCRLQRVEELRDAGRTYAHISSVLGFSCPAAFSRWYRTRRSE